MKYFRLLIVFILPINYCFSQNLVPNSSFENFTNCPTGTQQINEAVGWSSYSYTPDYYNVCSSPLTMGIPTNTWGNQSALDGNAYAGLYTYTPFTFEANSREYIGIELAQVLNVGTKYYFSAYVSRSEYHPTGAATNNIGFKFSNTSFSKTNPAPTNNFSHYRDTTIITDNVNWTKISGSFISDSSYKYLMIGNFYDDQNTNTQSNNQYAYYYIDCICVSTDSILCSIPTSINQLDNYSNATIYPNPFSNILNFSFENNKNSELIIYDSNMKTILNLNTLNMTTLNTEHFSRGLYFYEIRVDDLLVKTGKLVKP